MSVGYIYILSNRFMGRLLKIGYTCNQVAQRAKELSASTGVPSEFVIEYFRITDDVEAIERQVHESLSIHRCNDKREFFDLAIRDAVAVIDQMIVDPPQRFSNQQVDTQFDVSFPARANSSRTPRAAGTYVGKCACGANLELEFMVSGYAEDVRCPECRRINDFRVFSRKQFRL